MAFSGCPSDLSFGPNVRGCRDDFDFTLKLERIIFSILPSSLFITFALLRCSKLLRKPHIVDGAWFRLLKTIILAVALVLKITLLALAAAHAKQQKGLFVASATLDAVSAGCMTYLSFLEHSRDPRPSILLGSYLFLIILLDVAQTRTLWLASATVEEHTFAKVYTAATVIWAASFVLESLRKRRWLRRDVAKQSPEETCGIFELSTITWIFPLLWTGHRKILATSDLLQLDHALSAEALNKYAEDLRVSEFRGKKNALAWAFLRTLAVPLLAPVLPMIGDIALTLFQPLLLRSLLTYLSHVEEYPKNFGYGLIGAAILIFLGEPLSFTLYSYYNVRSLFMMRSVAVHAVYQKATAAKCTASDDAKAMTIMSTDVERIRFGLMTWHNLWAVPVKVGVSCWLLYRQLGASFVAPIVLMACLTLYTTIISRFIRPRQTVWMEKVETRVGKTTNIISNIKNIKISGLGPFLESSIQSMRIDELKAATKVRILQLLVMFAGFAPGALSSVLTFAVSGNNFDVATIFTSVALLELLADPLNSLFQMIPNFVSALACIQRIQVFLEAPEQEDFRKFHPPPPQQESHPTAAPEMASVIKIVNGNYGWEADKTILKNINLSFVQGLNVVVGPVASGKSTLCKVLLGETPFSQGEVSVALGAGKTSYCDQVPVLFNATIKENIVGFNDVDEERYKQVVQATMLYPDLEILARGDQTRVGSNGITLSGGQKQRVSIARALYHLCALYIFDDILSGLDTDTAQHVFNHVFGPDGLLNQRNATVVLCTHAVHYLPKAARIVSLDSDGRVVEQGTFLELVAKGGYVHDLGIHERQDESTGTTNTPPSERATTAPAAIKSVKEAPKEEDLDEKRSAGDFGVFIHYFASVGTVLCTVFMFSGVVCGFLWSFPNVWLAWWANDGSSPPQQHSNSYYIGIFGLLKSLSLLSTVFEIGTGSIGVARISGLNLHKDAIRTVAAAPLRYFVKTDVGVLINHFSQDMTLIDSELPMALLNAVAMLWIVIGSAAVAATSSVYLLIFYPFLGVIAFYLQRFYLSTSRQLRLLDLEAKSPLYTHFIDTIKGLATFRAFKWTGESIDKNSGLLDKSTNPAYLLAIIQRWLSCILRYFTALVAIIIVCLATQLKSSSGFAGASMVSLISFANFLGALISNYTLLETSLGAINRLREFGRSTEVEDLPGEDVIPPLSWPENGRIEIKGLSASYDYSPSKAAEISEKEEESGVKVLCDLDMVIEKGQKVAICGRTGSGKSSFILMLLRLLDPFPSPDLKLEIDGTSLTQIDRGTLRERLVAVPQEPVFLPNGTSFMENLDPRKVATEEECQKSLETVDLWSFTLERGGLQGGLSADAFSLGQKQLFSLARAILRKRVRIRQMEGARKAESERVSSNASRTKSDAIVLTETLPPHSDGGVLILDEYSSGLDIATDKIMQQIIRKEFRDYTIVMVSHRLEMVMEFDKVIVLDAGSVVEDGVPKELVEREGSRFRDLWIASNSE